MAYKLKFNVRAMRFETTERRHVEKPKKLVQWFID